MTENWDRVYDWLVTSGVRIVAIIAGAIIFYYFLRTVFRRALKVARKVGDGELVSREQEMRAKTLAGIIRGVLIGVIIAVVVLMVLNELGYNIGPLLAGAGIAGLALGFGAQTLVKDIIGGFFILLEGQFYVGDVIQSAGLGGKVEAIRLRTTLLRDDQGVLHILPNGEMRAVSNLTRGWSRALIDVAVDYREDINKVEALLERVALEVAEKSGVAQYITEPPHVQGVEEFTGKKVVIRLVARTQAFRDSQVASELRKRIAMALAQENVVVAGE